MAVIKKSQWEHVCIFKKIIYNHRHRSSELPVGSEIKNLKARVSEYYFLTIKNFRL
jgi:hypothetical protein